MNDVLNLQVQDFFVYLFLDMWVYFKKNYFYSL